MENFSIAYILGFHKAFKWVLKISFIVRSLLEIVLLAEAFGLPLLIELFPSPSLSGRDSPALSRIEVAKKKEKKRLLRRLSTVIKV